MRKVNLFLAGILTLLVVFMLVFQIGANLRASATVQLTPGANVPETFDSIRGILASGSAPQQFAHLPDDTANLTIKQVTIRLSNRGFFPAEWIDISLDGQPGDIAVYALDGEGSSVPARASRDLTVQLVTATGSNTRHIIRLTYYVYGMERTLSIKA